ncbi:MAG: hypothetical protein GY856_36420, partial [bacterium]|nr:hypothetical protein [bacterium]
REQRTVIVLDNLESVLPPAAGAPAAAVCEPEVLEELVELFGQLSATASTRLIFTSRQPLPEPFTRNHLTIDRLDRGDAVALVAQVLGSARLTPQAEDEGDSEEEIAELVEAVNGHARSLVLIAREVAGAGVRRATAGLHELMAKLQEKYGDDRERSLFASVELSLRRLPAETRQLIRPLAVFQGGGQLGAIGVVLGLAENQELLMTVAKQLVDVGLGELLPYGYLRLHPALGPALDHEFGVEEREAARLRWADAMVALISFLNQQRVQDAQLAATVTLRDLANVMAVLEYIRETADADRVVGVATRIEGLLANLGRPKALARAAEIRAVAAQELGEWSHARFLAESAAVDRLLEAGRVAEAVAAARAVLERAMAAGENAFPEAAYDIAMAHWELGRTLQMSGAAEAALGPLAEAEGRFRKLADQGDEDAARMASVAVTESGDCLRDLGRMDEAADAYEGAIELAQARKDVRSLAVNKGQLGTVRMFQRRYDQ